MGVRSLISFGLLLIPIAITVGVLVGLDAYRSSTGGAPLFPPNENPGSGSNNGGAGNPHDDSVHDDIYCQKAFGVHPVSNGEQFTLNPNQWNWNPTSGQTGGLCLYVTTLANGSYATDTTAPPFWATWQYPQNTTDPVHAFPNIKLDTKGILPVQLQTTSNVNVDIEWHYGVGDQPVSATDMAGVLAVGTAANAAIDMFLDSSSTNAQDASKAAYEVMVWLGYINTATTQPLGFAAGPLTSLVVDGTTFNLYGGQNGVGQNVLTWYATTVTELFQADLMLFLNALQTVQSTTVKVPSTSDYLGYLAFGTEAFEARQNVTFSVPSLSMQIVKT